MFLNGCQSDGKVFVATWWASHFGLRPENNTHYCVCCDSSTAHRKQSPLLLQSSCGHRGPFDLLKSCPPPPVCGPLAAHRGTHHAHAGPTDQQCLISVPTCSAQCIWTPASSSVARSWFCSWCLIMLSLAQIEFCRWNAAPYRSAF